jgi:hypothetical protein
MACIKNLGLYPCPVCLVPKNKIHLVGTTNDLKFRQKNLQEDTAWMASSTKRARELIFEDGRGIDSAPVNNVLGKGSRTPTLVCQIPYAMIKALLKTSTELVFKLLYSRRGILLLNVCA